MAAIQFRIHREYKDVSGFVVSMLEKCTEGFVFQHPEDEEVNRLHIHGYMFGPFISRKTCSEQIAKALNLKGNTDFFTSDKCSRKSPKPLDLSGAFCYGSKWDTIAPVYLKNISPDLLVELRSYSQKMGTLNNIQRNTVNKTEIVVLKEIKVKQKPTQYQHCITVVNRINELHPDLFSKPLAEQRRCIFEICYNYFRESELFMGKYKQLDFMDMVLMKWNCPEYKTLLFADFTKRTSQYIV